MKTNEEILAEISLDFKLWLFEALDKAREAEQESSALAEMENVVQQRNEAEQNAKDCALSKNKEQVRKLKERVERECMNYKQVTALIDEIFPDFGRRRID